MSTCFVREEESKKQDAHLRREMEEREKLHRETVERLHIQVRGLRFLCWVRPRKWLLATASLCCISDCPAGEEGPRGEEQHGGRSSHR